MAAPATTGDRIVLAAADNFGFIHLDKAGKRAALRGEHAAAQFGAEQPRRLIGAESELTLQLQRRDAIGVSGHQISGPEPGGQRQLRVMHDGSGGHRGLATAVGALIGPGLGLQPPGFAAAAAWADKPIRPARRGKILSAGRLVAKALLELEQGTREVGHCGHRDGYNILRPRMQRDKPSMSLRAYTVSVAVILGLQGCSDRKIGR